MAYATCCRKCERSSVKEYSHYTYCTVFDKVRQQIACNNFLFLSTTIDGFTSLMQRINKEHTQSCEIMMIAINKVCLPCATMQQCTSVCCKVWSSFNYIFCKSCLSSCKPSLKPAQKIHDDHHLIMD